MNRLLSLSLLFLALPTAAQAASQSYFASRFTAIRVEAPVRVIVTTGSSVTARGEGDRDMLDRLDVTVNGEMMTIRLKAPQFTASRASGPGQVILRVSTDQLNRIIAQGAGTVEVDQMRGLNGAISLAGPGSISVANLTMDTLTVAMLGEGMVSLGGRVLSGTVEMRGAGTLNAEKLTVGTLKINSGGAGSVTVTGGKSADIRTEGAGSINVVGTPACKVANIGSGRVTCGGKQY